MLTGDNRPLAFPGDSGTLWRAPPTATLLWARDGGGRPQGCPNAPMPCSTLPATRGSGTPPS